MVFKTPLYAHSKKPWENEPWLLLSMQADTRDEILIEARRIKEALAESAILIFPGLWSKQGFVKKLGAVKSSELPSAAFGRNQKKKQVSTATDTTNLRTRQRFESLVA